MITSQSLKLSKPEVLNECQILVSFSTFFFLKKGLTVFILAENLKAFLSESGGPPKQQAKLCMSIPLHGEGNGTPLQYSSLENPQDGGAWWAAVHGVAQSRARLKRLSSSSSSIPVHFGEMSPASIRLQKAPRFKNSSEPP